MTKDKPKRPPGRPPLHEGENMTRRSVRLPDSLWDKIERAADGNLSAWIRKALERAVKRRK